MSRIDFSLEIYHKFVKQCIRLHSGSNQLERVKIGILTETTKILENYKKELDERLNLQSESLINYGNILFYARSFEYLLRIDCINKEYYECLSYPNNINIYDLIKVALKLNTSRNIDIIQDQYKRFLAYLFKIIEVQELSIEQILNTFIKRESATTTIPQQQWGVHRIHCCFEHGCKYGDKDCPVELGLIKQDSHCEMCNDKDCF